jgi:hypothetical protein
MIGAFDWTALEEHFESSNYLVDKVRKVYLRPMQISKSLAGEK